MKNKLSDLNDHLFAQIERLANEEFTPEKIEIEVKRGNAWWLSPTRSYAMQRSKSKPPRSCPITVWIRRTIFRWLKEIPCN
jgi:hypothetical protein